MDFGKYRNYFLVILALVILYVLSSKAYENKESKIRMIPAGNEGSSYNKSKPILKLYYTNWCGWSKKFLPTWAKLEKSVKNVKFEAIDCEKNKGMCDKIPGYPFLILEKNGKKITYNGDRSYADVTKFLNKN